MTKKKQVEIVQLSICFFFSPPLVTDFRSIRVLFWFCIRYLPQGRNSNSALRPQERIQAEGGYWRGREKNPQLIPLLNHDYYKRLLGKFCSYIQRSPLYVNTGWKRAKCVLKLRLSFHIWCRKIQTYMPATAPPPPLPKPQPCPHQISLWKSQ